MVDVNVPMADIIRKLDPIMDGYFLEKALKIQVPMFMKAGKELVVGFRTLLLVLGSKGWK